MEITRDNLLTLIKSGIVRDALSVAGLEKKAQVPKDTVRDFLRGKTQILRADKLQKILSVIEPSDTVRIAGVIGPGGEISFYPPEAASETVACPPECDPSDVIAVRVEGDAMQPIYHHGWIVYFSRRGDIKIPVISGGWQVPYDKPGADRHPKGERFTPFLGKPSIIGLEGGRVFAGTLKRSKEQDTYDILHYTDGSIKNVVPQWAAKIIFIKTE